MLDPGIEPGSPASQADSSPSELPGKPQMYVINHKTIGPNTALIYSDKSWQPCSVWNNAEILIL